MSLNSTLIASRLLTRPSAPLIVSTVSGCSAPVVMGQMADFISLMASGSTWTVMYKPCQCSASCSVVVVGSECSLRRHYTPMNHVGKTIDIFFNVVRFFGKHPPAQQKPIPKSV
ncbi:hypothetical protein Tco_1171107, partial [Tanacetum coccineum]